MLTLMAHALRREKAREQASVGYLFLFHQMIMVNIIKHIVLLIHISYFYRESL